jgi:hypothetical protein
VKAGKTHAGPSPRQKSNDTAELLAFHARVEAGRKREKMGGSIFSLWRNLSG